MDTAAWGLTWWGLAVVACMVLGALPIFSDNPWGAMVFAVGGSFFPAGLVLAALESSTGRSPGRQLTRLAVVHRTGRALTRRERAQRGVLKYGVVIALLALGLVIATTLNRGEESLVHCLAPLAVYAALNAACSLARRDGRSLLDLAANSRSIRPR